MRIIINNYALNREEKPSEPIKKVAKCKCDNCQSEFEFEESDTRIGEYGVRFVDCPCCGEENITEDFTDIELTKENVRFPQHYAKCGVGYGIEITDEEVDRMVLAMIDYLDNHEDEEYYSTWSGDTFYFIERIPEDEEYEVTVAKSFFNTFVPFER